MILAYLVDGAVREIIQPLLDDEGAEVPMSERFTKEFLESCVDVTNLVPLPSQGEIGSVDVQGVWAFAPYTPPPPTQAEILSTNTFMRDLHLDAATRAIAPLQDAVDLGIATGDETTLLTKWKQYRVAVNRVNLAQEGAAWPLPPVTPA